MSSADEDKDKKASAGEEEKASAISKWLDKAKEFVAEKLGNVPTPEATVTKVDLNGAALDGINLGAKVSVNNPYPSPIPICEVSYILKSAGRTIASGTIPDPGSLKASDTTMVDIPVKVPYSILVSLGIDVARDWDIDYELDLGLTIDLPVVGNITIPLSTSGEIKLPTLKDLIFSSSSSSTTTS